MERKNDLNALIVEGGAMRTIFSVGVLDTFLSHKFNLFDILIGVSAGAANIAAYLAEMKGRNYKIITEYSLNPEFISFKKFIKGGHLMDLDWMWTKTIKEMRLDLKKIFSHNKKFIVVATSAETGKPVYLEPNEENLEHYLKVSSGLPLLYRNFLQVNDEVMVDGGFADSIPVNEAIKKGAKHIMIIRSRKKNTKKKDSITDKLIPFFLKKYPNLQKAMRNRNHIYNDTLNFIQHPPKDIKIYEIAPPDSFNTSRLTRDFEILNHDYKLGLELGEMAIKDWVNYKIK